MIMCHTIVSRCKVTTFFESVATRPHFLTKFNVLLSLATARDRSSLRLSVPYVLGILSIIYAITLRVSPCRHAV